MDESEKLNRERFLNRAFEETGSAEDTIELARMADRFLRGQSMTLALLNGEEGEPALPAPPSRPALAAPPAPVDVTPPAPVDWVKVDGVVMAALRRVGVRGMTAVELAIEASVTRAQLSPRLVLMVSRRELESRGNTAGKRYFLPVEAPAAGTAPPSGPEAIVPPPPRAEEQRQPRPASNASPHPPRPPVTPPPAAQPPRPVNVAPLDMLQEQTLDLLWVMDEEKMPRGQGVVVKQFSKRFEIERQEGRRILEALVNKGYCTRTGHNDDATYIPFRRRSA